MHIKSINRNGFRQRERQHFALQLLIARELILREGEAQCCISDRRGLPRRADAIRPRRQQRGQMRERPDVWCVVHPGEHHRHAAIRRLHQQRRAGLRGEVLGFHPRLHCSRLLGEEFRQLLGAERVNRRGVFGDVGEIGGHGIISEGFSTAIRFTRARQKFRVLLSRRGYKPARRRGGRVVCKTPVGVLDGEAARRARVSRPESTRTPVACDSMWRGGRVV